MSKIDSVRTITRFIREEETRLREKFTWLRHQNLLGMTIFLGSISMMIAFGIGYYYGFSAWIVIPASAFFASLLHELEHDLIHGLYFKDRWQEKLMFWGVWIFRGNTPSPFYRKKIHLLHHKDSGQVSDIEEQMIGNGMKYGIRRIITMVDQNLAFLLNARKVAKTAPDLHIPEMVRSAFPVMALWYAAFDVMLLAWGLQLAGFNDLFAYQQEITSGLTFAGVVYLWPNFLRQVSIQIVSSNMHYFGDVTPGKEGLSEQTQILDHWLFLPMHLFCFNFGSTHGIHHFVVNQPFYLRQMVAFRAIPFMISHGVRHNDFGTFGRANRYSDRVTAEAEKRRTRHPRQAQAA